LALPVRWAVSIDVSDVGYAAIGGQNAAHAGLLVLVGPPGTAMSTQARPLEAQAYRPGAQFYPNGTRLLLNESIGLTTFDVQRVR
jgi:hypothetical protein